MPAMARFRRGNTKPSGNSKQRDQWNRAASSAPIMRRRLPRELRLVATTRATRDATP